MLAAVLSFLLLKLVNPIVYVIYIIYICRVIQCRIILILKIMTLTEIIKALEEAKANGTFDMYSESITHREAIHLCNDISLLRSAIASLKELKECGSQNFFNGSMSK